MTGVLAHQPNAARNSAGGPSKFTRRSLGLVSSQAEPGTKGTTPQSREVALGGVAVGQARQDHVG